MVAQIKLLDYVMARGGVIKLPEPTVIYDCQILTIKAVYFTEQPPEDDYSNPDPDQWPWNMYVQKIEEAIGVDTYCSWVRDRHRNVIGLIAFFDVEDKEVKIKYFEDFNINWLQLLTHIKQHDNTI